MAGYQIPISLATANASSNASSSIATNERDKTTKIDLLGYLFSTQIAITAIGKYRRILVTIHGTTDIMYTTIQCLQKHYRPDSEIIKGIQCRFHIY